MSEPFVDRCDGDSGFVAHGEFVVPGGDGSVAFEPVDAAFDGVTLLVDLLVERWSATALPAPFLAVADLVCFLRDGAPNAPFPQVGAIGAGTVCLVRQHPVRAGTGTSPPGAGHVDPLQHGRELGRVAPLPGGDHDRQG